jgi:nitrate/nitrite transporter NarK
MSKDMKKFIIPILIIAILIALYEQVNAEKKVYIMVIALLIFMFGMMRLSSKTPSKNKNKEEDYVQ